MVYMGSKGRFARQILPIILKDRPRNMPYIEPFAGGLNVIQYVRGERIANDVNKWVFALFDAVINRGWIPPKYISELQYKEIRDNKDYFPPELVAYVGFASFGGQWFNGYPRAKDRCKYLEVYNNLMIQAKRLKGVKLFNKDYKTLDYSRKSIIYCDPPYSGTKQYKNCPVFDSNDFWGWAEEMHKKGHIVYVSEYKAPKNWNCVWEKTIKFTLDNNNTKGETRTERLFSLVPQLKQVSLF